MHFFIYLFFIRPCRYEYDWSKEEAKKNLLRYHKTAVSARMLYELAKVYYWLYVCCSEFFPLLFFIFYFLFLSLNYSHLILGERERNFSYYLCFEYISLFTLPYAVSVPRKIKREDKFCKIFTFYVCC